MMDCNILYPCRIALITSSKNRTNLILTLFFLQNFIGKIMSVQNDWGQTSFVNIQIYGCYTICFKYMYSRLQNRVRQSIKSVFRLIFFVLFAKNTLFNYTFSGSCVNVYFCNIKRCFFVCETKYRFNVVV